MSFLNGIKLTREIKLSVSIALVVGVVGTLIFSLSQGKTASAKRLKGKVLRRTGNMNRPLTPWEIASLRQQNPPERTLKTNDFKDNPLSVQKIRNLDSDTWHKDFEIEIKNEQNAGLVSVPRFSLNQPPGYHKANIAISNHNYLVQTATYGNSFTRFVPGGLTGLAAAK